MAYAVSSIKTVVVIAILATLAVTMMVSIQGSSDVNETTDPEAYAAQEAINASTWNSLRMVGIVMLVNIIAVVMKYLNFI